MKKIERIIKKKKENLNEKNSTKIVFIIELMLIV